MIGKILITSGLLSLSCLASYGWGQKGHDTTAYIAENHLIHISKDFIEDLLYEC